MAAGHDDKESLGGQRVGLAMVAIVIGTGLAVAYIASDGTLFDPVFDLVEPAAASNNGPASSVGNNIVEADSVHPGNIFERGPDELEPAPQSDTGNVEEVQQLPLKSAAVLSDAEKRQLMAIKEYPWEIVLDNATTAETQKIIDSLEQLEDGADRPELKQLVSGEMSPGISAVASEGMLIDDNGNYAIIQDNTIEEEDDDARIEPEPMHEDDGSEVPDMERQSPEDAPLYVPEDVQEVLDMIEEELEELPDIINEGQEDDNRTSDDKSDESGNSGPGPDEEKRSDKSKFGRGHSDDEN